MKLKTTFTTAALVATLTTQAYAGINELYDSMKNKLETRGWQVELNDEHVFRVNNDDLEGMALLGFKNPFQQYDQAKVALNVSDLQKQEEMSMRANWPPPLNNQTQFIYVDNLDENTNEVPDGIVDLVIERLQDDELTYVPLEASSFGQIKSLYEH